MHACDINYFVTLHKIIKSNYLVLKTERVNGHVLREVPHVVSYNSLVSSGCSVLTYKIRPQMGLIEFYLDDMRQYWTEYCLCDLGTDINERILVISTRVHIK